MTSRENLLQTLRCGNPQWVPVCPALFPNENPTKGVPEQLAEVFNSCGNDLASAILRWGDYLGAEDHMLPVPCPASLVSDVCTSRSQRVGARTIVATLSTPRGELRQVTTCPDGQPSFVTERYLKTAQDAIALKAYFESLRVQVVTDAVIRTQATRDRLGDRGILFCRTPGTPLGMCYRQYANFADLIYLMADEPKMMGDLFACMEEKYFRLHEAMLEAAPGIDAFLGMDDTSTTLISPAMFETHNVGLTNRRADLCHAFGKLYLHHSCGLIRDLLPIYRRTRMDGVDALTLPPIGNVGYSDARRLLGPRYCMHSGLASGLQSMDPDAILRHVTVRFEDALKARFVSFGVGGAHLSFEGLVRLFGEAHRLRRQ
jgi:hypothetical protein